MLNMVMERGLKRAQKKCAEARTAQEAIELFIVDFLDFRDRLRRGLNSPRRAVHEDFVLKTTRKFVSEVLDRYTGIKKLSLNDYEFLLEYVSACIVHAILWYGVSEKLDVGEFSRQMDHWIACKAGFADQTNA